MATLIFDLDSTSFYKNNTVSNANSTLLYSSSMYSPTSLPTPEYKAVPTELSFSNNNYTNSICAIFKFNTQTITTNNVITSAKLSISGKKGTLTDNVILQIFGSSAQAPPATGDPLLSSINLNSFSASASEIRDIVIPSNKLNYIQRTVQTVFVISTNFATDRILPTGVNQFIFGHEYITEPATPLKIQLIIEVIPINPTPTTPIIFDTITPPGQLPSSTSNIGNFTVSQINQQKEGMSVYLEGGILKTALDATYGFITINSSSILNPSIETIFDTRDVWPPSGKFIQKYAVIAPDGSRAIAPCSGEPHNLVLLKREGATYIPAGEITTNFQYSGLPIIVKQGSRYLGFIAFSQTGAIISDITNFVLPDNGSPATIPSEAYQTYYNFTINDKITYLDSSKKLIVFSESIKASLNFIDVTSPGAVGSLVSTCPITKIDLKQYGYIDHTGTPSTTEGTLVEFGITTHPTTGTIYITCIKQVGDPASNTARIIAEIYELTDTYQLINKKFYEVFSYLPGNIFINSSVLSFATTKTAYSVFLSTTGGLYPDKLKLIGLNLESPNLADVSYVSVPYVNSKLLLNGIYNNTTNILSLITAGAGNNQKDIFSSYSITLKEEGVIITPSGPSGPSVTNISFTPTTPTTNDTVTIGVSVTAGTGGAVVSYEFNFGDGSSLVTTTTPTTTHRYTSAGTYGVVVKATDGAGGSGSKNSNLVVSGTPASNPIAPDVPRNLSIISGNGQITLAWVPPVSDGGAPITNYSIIITHNGATNTLTTPDGSLSYTVTGLTNGDTYGFSIAAINSASLTGQYTQEISTTVSTTTQTFNLIPWKKFNGATINYGTVGAVNIENPGGWTPFPVCTSGLNALVRSSSLTELYESPQDIYPNTEELGKFSIKYVYREQNPVTVGAQTTYRPADQYTISTSYKAFIEGMIAASYGGSMISPPVWATWPIASRIASLLALPGDVKKIFDYAHSLYDTVTPPSNTIIEDVWHYNISTPGCTDPSTCPLPGFAYSYAISRPFLLFDTRSISQQTPILKVLLEAASDENFRPTNPGEISNLYFKKANIQSDDNISPSDFNAIDTVNAGECSVPFITGGGGSCVDGPGGQTLCFDMVAINYNIGVELDPSVITKNGFTKIAVLSNLDYAVLPQTWNSMTYSNVKLTIITGIDQVTVPGTVTNLSATPGNKTATLAWDPPINNGGSGITHYLVKNLNTNEVITVTDLTNRTYTFSNLTNDILYTFAVIAVNAQGEGAPYMIAATPSASIAGVPGPVQNLFSTPLNSSVGLSWNAPISNGGKQILNYQVYNLTTGEYNLLPPSTYSYIVMGLTNGTTYTFRVNAINEVGAGPVSEVSETPTDFTTVPPIPTIETITTTITDVTVVYTSTGDGGSPITEWLIKVTNLSTNIDTYYTITDPSQLSYTISGLKRDLPYRICITAVNALGQSAWACTEAFALKNDGTTTPTLKVPINFNYSVFYPAPVELNPASDNYLNYIYPETVYEDIEAYIQSFNVKYPVSLPSTSNKLYITNSSVNYEINIPFTGWLKLDSLVDYLNKYFITNSIEIVALAINNNLVLRTYQKGEGIFINFGKYLSKVDQVNSILFGNDPLFVSGTRLYKVENNVPTTEYDAVTNKALIESEPYTTIRSLDVKSSFNQEQNTNNTYSLQLLNNIKPNSITLYYYGNNNNIMFLRDYLGDGVLRVRVKEETSLGDPITFKYLIDSVTNTDILGKIDYKTGLISEIVFPSTTEGSTIKTPLIVGNGVTWPLEIPNNSWIYLRVNGLTFGISIPYKQPTIADARPLYKLTELVDVLNNTSLIKKLGLVVGSFEGQLYIKNVGYDVSLQAKNSGPNISIELANDSYNLNSVNFLLFGLKPKTILSSPFFITYSYKANYKTDYKHVWYQTPHFTLVSKGNPSNFITKAHLSYLLDKLNIARPVNTSLDNINFSPLLEEVTYVRDELILTTGTNITVPYLEVSNLIGQPTGHYPVKVINPDLQEYTSNISDINTSYFYKEKP